MQIFMQIYLYFCEKMYIFAIEILFIYKDKVANLFFFVIGW